jgi:hypothetical protein
MQDTTMVLRDVELRLRALEEARQVRAMAAGAMAQLRAAKQRAAEAEAGSPLEQQYLREAADASTRVASLRESLSIAERELRRTAYLLELLSE